MKKIIPQVIIVISLFFGIWFSLRQVSWVKLFKVEKATDNTEKALGDMFLEAYVKENVEHTNVYITSTVDSIVTHICEANDIDREGIKVHVVDKDEVNAFALPDGHLIIYSGLILNADNQDELTGVICHEIAHITLNHIMKALIKEIGLSVLISMATGNQGAEIIQEAGKMLSSLAFDRSLEKEADIAAVDYMLNAKVDPESFANFLYKLSLSEHEHVKYLSWISTHPDSKERAEYVIEYGKNDWINYEPILNDTTWNNLKVALEDQ